MIPWLNPRGLAILAVAYALLFAACGDDNADKPDGSNPHQGLNSGEVSEMAASPEFNEARERMLQCLRDAGYVQDAAGKVTLNDGSKYPPDTGDRIEITSARLDYQIENERCLHESGLASVLQSYGRADPTPDPALVKRTNDQVVRKMQCMAEKGWEIPEPKTLRGFLHFNVQQPPERQDAWDIDSAACNDELAAGR